MPSSPQTIPLIQIFDYVMVGNTPQANIDVFVTLNYSQANFTNPVVAQVPMSFATSTDNNGYWTLSVPANSGNAPTLSPSGTLYSVQYAPAVGYKPFLINVSNVGVPGGGWQASAITVSAPAVLAPAGQTVGPLTVNGQLTVNGNEIVTGGLDVSGSSSGYTGGEIRFPTAGNVTAALSTSQLTTGIMAFVHRANANTGSFQWLNGTNGATLLLTLNSAGSLIVVGPVISYGTQGATIDDNVAGNQIRFFTATGGKSMWLSAPGGITLNNAVLAATGIQLGNGAPAAAPDVHSDGANLFFEATGPGNFFFRPNGLNNNTNQIQFNINGSIFVASGQGLDVGTAGQLTIGTQTATSVAIRGPQKTLIVGTALTTFGAGAQTMTAAQLQGGVIEGAPAAAANYTTDTGTNLDAAVTSVATGDSFQCILANTSGGANTITILAGAGVTLRGGVAVAQNKTAIMNYRRTGANAWTCYVTVGT